MIPPDAGYLVEHRFERVGCLGHKSDRKIGHHIRICQRAESDEDEQELAACRRCRDTHQRRVVPVCADERQDALGDGQHEGQNDRVMTDFSDHRALSFWLP